MKPAFKLSQSEIDAGLKNLVGWRLENGALVRDYPTDRWPGAGIVWDSEPAAECQETLAKARTMIESLTSPRRMPRTRGRAHPPV